MHVCILEPGAEESTLQVDHLGARPYRRRNLRPAPTDTIRPSEMAIASAQERAASAQNTRPLR